MIDKRRRDLFRKEAVPNAPPLTDDERKLVNRCAELEKTMTDAPRVHGSVAEPIEKFMKWQGNYNWGKVRRGGVYWISSSTTDVWALSKVVTVADDSSH